ncbi:MAG: hypothetical protein JNJ58_03510 [Chitinophagaceae bacterium]|nr:hypothetical protein [Chitinophagaceae bacterium]
MTKIKLITTISILLEFIALNCFGQSSIEKYGCNVRFEYSQDYYLTGIDTFKLNSKLINYSESNIQKSAMHIKGETYFLQEIDDLTSKICEKIKNEKGLLVLELEIGISGRIQNINVAHSFSPEIDEYAKQYFYGKPAEWIPANVSTGQSINSYMQLFIFVNLSR